MRRKFSLLGVICATAAKLIHNRVARFTGWAVNKQLWGIVNQPRSFFSYYFRRECGSLAGMIYGKFVMNAKLVRNADGEHFWMESLLSLERSKREIRRREMFTRSGFSINRNDGLCRISIDNFSSQFISSSCRHFCAFRSKSPRSCWAHLIHFHVEPALRLAFQPITNQCDHWKRGISSDVVVKIIMRGDAGRRH